MPWELVASKSDDDTGSTFIDRLPKIYKTGVQAVDQERDLKRKALQSIIRLLWNEEEHVFAVKFYLEGKVE